MVSGLVGSGGRFTRSGQIDHGPGAGVPQKHHRSYHQGGRDAEYRATSPESLLSILHYQSRKVLIYFSFALFTSQYIETNSSEHRI